MSRTPLAPGRPRILRSLCLVAVLFLFVRTFVLQSLVVNSDSMQPTLLAGDHLLVVRMTSSSSSPLPLLPRIGRGDIIIFKSPGGGQRDLVKRVVALPGETIAIRQKAVYIDDQPLREGYTQFILGSEPSLGNYGRSEYGPLTVPPDSYFVLGDNRDHSEDSRHWGPISGSLLKGKLAWVYFSSRRKTAAASTDGEANLRLNPAAAAQAAPASAIKPACVLGPPACKLRVSQTTSLVLCSPTTFIADSAVS